MAGPSGFTPLLGLPYPVDADNVDASRDIKALADKLDPIGTVPIGAIMMWMATAAPTNWLLCQGQTVLATDYPGLATVLGQTGGNVTLPALGGRFPIGANATHPLKQVGGEETHLLTASESGVKDHQHNMTSNDFGGGAPALMSSGGKTYIRGDQGGIAAAANGLYPKYTDSGYSWGYGVGGVFGGAVNASTAHNNMPPFISINFIIRAR